MAAFERYLELYTRAASVGGVDSGLFAIDEMDQEFCLAPEEVAELAAVGFELRGFGGRSAIGSVRDAEGSWKEDSRLVFLRAGFLSDAYESPEAQEATTSASSASEEDKL